MKINLLKVENLKAQKGQYLLFKDIKFKLKNGQSLLLKGPNGSGKTTLLYILATNTCIKNGLIQLFIKKNKKPRADGLIGISHFISHKNTLKKNLTVFENLTFWTEYLNGNKLYIKNALQIFKLETISNVLVSQLSEGQKKRLILTKLLTVFYPLWLLDEPSVSLDNDGLKIFNNLMQNHINKGGIIIASSHVELGIKFTKIINLTNKKYIIDNDYY